MHVVPRQVLHREDLDKALELLADLVGLGVTVVDLQGDPRPARLAARADRDAAHVKSAAADHPRDLGQRVRPVLDEHRQDANTVGLLRGRNHWFRLDLKHIQEPPGTR